MRAAAGGRAAKGYGESAVLAKLAALPQPDRAMGERLHVIIKADAPALMPRTWYGMPAHAKDGNVVCLFQSAQKFKTRHATFGFSDKAALDEGHMWPTAFALNPLLPAEWHPPGVSTDARTFRPGIKWIVVSAPFQPDITDSGSLRSEADGLQAGRNGPASETPPMFANLHLEKCRAFRRSGPGVIG
jgi:hypothetical protein